MAQTILAIEDEQDLAKIIQAQISAAKYNVVLAFDGEEGLAKAKELKPDLIVLDLMLPKIDGYRICEFLKADPQYKHIPIIILSARTAKIEQKAGFAAGADAYLIKPYEGEILLAKIKELLKQKNK
jgi:DNA-binding response OmpR family regulator